MAYMRNALFLLLVNLAIPSAWAQPVPTVPQTGRVLPSVPQVGVPQVGVPQTGRPLEGRPQTNPDGSRPRVLHGWRPPVTVIYGERDEGYIPFPSQFNLPNPGPGYIWQRIRNDAVLLDLNRGTIVQVRQRWFG